MKSIFNVILIAIIALLLPQLEGIIQKSMADENALFITTTSTNHSIQPLNLSTEEKQWLTAHPVITVAVSHGWAPIAFISESQKFLGISVDYLKKFEAILGVKFELVSANDDYAYETADIIAALANPKALANTRFSAMLKPYISTPYSIYTQKETHDISHLNDLNGKKVSIYKMGKVVNIISQEYPNIKLLKADIAQESLAALANHEVAAYIGNSLIVDYVASQEGFNNIKSVGNTEYSSTIFMGVRNDWPLMMSILDKSFNAIDDTENEKVLSSWRPNLITPYLNNKSIINVGAGLLLIFTLLALWNKSLKKEIRNKTIVQNELSQTLVEIKKNELTLMENKRRLKELALVAERTTNPVVITNKNGIITWVNQAFISGTGFQFEFVVGKKPGSFLQGAETSQETVSIMRQAIKNHEDFNVEILNYNVYGEKFWTNIISNVIDPTDQESGFISVQVDITKNKFQLEEVAHSGAIMRALFGMSLYPIAVLNTEQRVSNINSAFCSLFNVSEAEIVGIKEVELDNFFQTICANKYLATSNFPHKLDLDEGTFFASTDNHLLNFEIKSNKNNIARSYLDCKQASISRIIYYRDVTKEYIVEKMKSEFVATAAHELRTPMTIIFGYAELLRITPPSVDMQKYMIDVIHDQSKSIINLLNDILDIARIEARIENVYDMKYQAIGPLLKHLAETFITPGNHNLTEFEISATLPKIYIDALKIEQAVKNCLSNAYKFSPNNLPVKMKVTKVKRKDKSEILISIQDQGIGMTPEQLERVFEKFYRADPSGSIPGTGLGMAIIKEIIEHHGGYVEIKSEHGVGTNVLIHLPITKQLTEVKEAVTASLTAD